jgi:hypothetical protein
MLYVLIVKDTIRDSISMEWCNAHERCENKAIIEWKRGFITSAEVPDRIDELMSDRGFQPNGS